MSTGTDEKCRRCEALGAAAAINYNTADFAAHMKGIGAGVDVLLDSVCGDFFDRSLKMMNADGRVVVIGLQRGPVVTADLTRLMLKRLTVTGSTLRAQSPLSKVGGPQTHSSCGGGDALQLTHACTPFSCTRPRISSSLASITSSFISTLHAHARDPVFSPFLSFYRSIARSLDLSISLACRQGYAPTSPQT